MIVGSKTITKSQEASRAIERMYIAMRHLFNRGFYKPMGVSGETLKDALLALQPEIYGSMASAKTELNGLMYVLDRLPKGIEQCTYINLISEEGYRSSDFKAIIPPKRRRNCYRIDADQMNIEITRGRSDIYDVITHLTFFFIEAQKIATKVYIKNTKETSRDWHKLELTVNKKKLTADERAVAIAYCANILGHTFKECANAHKIFATEEDPERFLKIIFWMGNISLKELSNKSKRSITFSRVLQERIGHHIHGEIWADNIKKILANKKIINRPIHIISANMHSVMNSLFASSALKSNKTKDLYELFELLSEEKNETLRKKVKAFSEKNGMITVKDHSGTNINVQIFDTQKITSETLKLNKKTKNDYPLLLVMDYAFGEQAYETIDELLKPYKFNEKEVYLNVESISIMGKAGILQGEKGDIMIPNAHIFEGTADNYPFKNELSKDDFSGVDVAVCEGSMVSVLGTSIQNKEILKFFKESTWNVIGLEMEGAHYQKAIQAASKIRKSIAEKVKVRYAYYASDNPLKTGSTLASGGLGITGVKPTYLITKKILEQIFTN